MTPEPLPERLVAETLVALMLPLTATSLPDWLISELLNVNPEPFHTAMVPAVPLPPTAPPPPVPTQLPAVVQTSSPPLCEPAVKLAALFFNATLALSRASARVPVLMLLAFW